MAKILTVALLFFLSFPSALLAQVSIGPGDRLDAIILASKTGSELSLSVEEYNGKIEVRGKSLSIRGISGSGTTIRVDAGQSVVFVDATASLSLDSIRLVGANDNQTGIFVDGGVLKITNSVIEGPFNFGIYATAGSKIELENVVIKNGMRAVYLLNSEKLVVRNSEFLNLSNSAFQLSGAKLISDLSGLKIENVASTAILVLNGANARISSSSISSVKDNAIYVDKQAGISIKDITIDTVQRGILGIDAGEISIDNLKIESYSVAGITINAAQKFSARNINLNGKGSGIYASGKVPAFAIDTATLQNTNNQQATLYIATTGAVDVARLSTEGGYSGVYIRGGRTAATLLRSSEISGGSFAGIILKEATATTKEFAPHLDGIQIINQGSGYALALDNTPFAKISNVTFLTNGKPPISSYQSGRIDLENSILATSSKEWLNGRIDHNAFIPSRANIIETGLDFNAESIESIKRRLVQKQLEAVKLGLKLGKVFAVVENDGFELSGDVVEILLADAGGKITDIPSNGNTIELASGIYDVTIDGTANGKLTITPGGIAIIPIPEPQHPYFLYKKGKQLLRGRKMELLDRQTLRRNYLARGVVTRKNTYWTGEGFGLARAELTKAERNNLLQEARGLYFDTLSDAHEAYNNRRNKKLRQATQVVRYAGAVISALGTREDRNRILSSLPKESSVLRNESINLAAFIEARLGLVKKSRLFVLAQENVTDNPALALSLAAASAVMGNLDAVKFLVEQATQPDFEIKENWNEVFVIPSILARSGDPRILSLFREVLAEYKGIISAMTKHSQERIYNNKNRFNFGLALPMIMEYVAAWGDESDRSLLALPIGGDFRVSSDISAIVKDPIAIYLDQIGFLPRPEPRKLQKWAIPSFGQTICQSLERRSKSERDEILETYKNLPGIYLNKAFKLDYREGYEWIISKGITQVTSAYCNPSTDLAIQFRANVNINFVFKPDDQFLPWLDRPSKAQQILDSFNPDGWPPFTTSMTRPLSQMTVDAVAKVTEKDPRFKTKAGKALLLNHRALSYRYQEPNPDIYQNGADRRLFLTQPAAANGEAALVGRLDMKPVIRSGLFRVGLRLRVAYLEKAFLPQMSGRPEILAAALAKGSFGFIKSVKLRRGGDSIPLKYDRFSKSGMHIFSVPLEDASLKNLYVDVELGVIKEKWKFSFPLFIGDFAFRYRTGLP